MSSGAPDQPGEADEPASGAGVPSPDSVPNRDNVLAGLRVLLAEDNPVNRVLAQAALQQWDVVVTMAEDGEEAVEAVAMADLAGLPFHVVLMDLQMPRMDGLEATRLLRKTHGPQRLPIVAVTAAVQQSDRDAAAAAGMTGYLAKPIDAQALHELLLQLLPPEGDASA